MSASNEDAAVILDPEDVFDAYSNEVLSGRNVQTSDGRLLEEGIRGDLSDAQKQVHFLCKLLMISGTPMERDLLSMYNEKGLSPYVKSYKDQVTHVAASAVSVLSDPGSFDVDAFIAQCVVHGEITAFNFRGAMLPEHKDSLNLHPPPQKEGVKMADYVNYATLGCRGKGKYGPDNAWNLANPCVNCKVCLCRIP